MKILIVDDNRLNITMTSTYCRNWGHTVVTAINGAEAVERYLADKPDLILMDVMMPIMDGFEATSRIRLLSEPNWVPIILLTALDNDEDLVRGVASGADDYLTKPVNFTILREKIRIMQRIATIQGQLTESLSRLEDYRDKAEEERHLAAHVMDRIVRFGQIDDDLVHHHLIPALNFSGDVVAWARTPGDDLHVLLGDATGHGLAAALSVMPVTEVFYGMTAKGFPIPRIADEINRKIRRLMPRERFVAAVLASVQFATRTIQIWNGGCPAALFLDQSGEVIRTWPSLHPPLGILPEDAFSAEVDVYQWSGEGQLLMCSDGLLEAEDQDGVAFSLWGLVNALEGVNSNGRIEQILMALHAHLAGGAQGDDVSLVTVDCPDRHIQLAEARPSQRRYVGEAGSWCLKLCLSPHEFRQIDVLPFLLDWCHQTGLDEHRLSKLFVVIAELYNNALDHGLLQLDSRLKAGIDGFEHYIRLRGERLAQLQEGHITLELSVVEFDEVPAIRVQVIDSGSGFDHTAISKGLTDSERPSGRGLALIQNLCRQVSFQRNGSDVTAIFPLD